MWVPGSRPVSKYWNPTSENPDVGTRDPQGQLKIRLVQIGASSSLMQNRVPQAREAEVPGKRSLLGWEASLGLFSRATSKPLAQPA
jgi:hypothetical protein